MTTYPLTSVTIAYGGTVIEGLGSVEWDAAPPTVDEMREAARLAAQPRLYECSVTLVSPRIHARLERLAARLQAAEVIAERARIARRPRRIPIICGVPRWQR